MILNSTLENSQVSASVKIVRIYLRVSTDQQDLERQESIVEEARAAGCYIAAVYREKASGARADRPELLRMISDLQFGELVIAEKIDRISRLPLADAEKLVAAIRGKGARLAIPGVLDLSELIETSQGVAYIVLDSLQNMLLRLSLQMAREDYEDRRRRQKQGIALAREAGRYSGRTPNRALHARVVALRESGNSISQTARLAECSVSQVKRICSANKKK
ncbi:recombinase family protein [Acetobacter orientalis]|uniref:recombinase family protein n=1 Tax=Acetobacter orientalis TaxID=146474 RepID=UPI00241C77D4|nr:recombinase family protein [Acetobacter orientalis]